MKKKKSALCYQQKAVLFLNTIVRTIRTCSKVQICAALSHLPKRHNWGFEFRTSAFKLGGLFTIPGVLQENPLEGLWKNGLLSPPHPPAHSFWFTRTREGSSLPFVICFQVTPVLLVKEYSWPPIRVTWGVFRCHWSGMCHGCWQFRKLTGWFSGQPDLTTAFATQSPDGWTLVNIDPQLHLGRGKNWSLPWHNQHSPATTVWLLSMPYLPSRFHLVFNHSLKRRETDL